MNSLAALAKELLAYFQRLARRWKLVTIRKLLYIPHILSRQEKKLFILLMGVTLAGGIGFVTRMYLGLTHPVPAVGGSYAEGIFGNPYSINPLYASSDTDRDMTRLVFSGLLAYNGTGEVQHDLAERHEISADGKTYTVFLRKYATWHDGKTLDADDVVFTIHTIQNPQYKSPFRSNWQGVEVEKLDQHTVRFSLRSPYAPFIENLTQGIIPKHLWERINPDQAVLHELNIKPIGSGPYKAGKFRQKADGALSSYELNRNSDYFGEGPYLKKIIFKFFKTEDEMVQAWRKKDIDGFGPISVSRASDMPRSSVSILNLQMPRVFSLFFNAKNAPELKDSAIRAAIAAALDKGTIANRATLGGGIVINQLLPPTNLRVDGETETHPYDPGRARELLNKAGWRLTDNGIRTKKITEKGKTAAQELRFTLSTSDWPELIRAAHLIQEMLREVGIAIDIEEKTFSELDTSVIRPRSFELLLFGQVYGYEPDPFAFWHSSQVKDPGLNVALYANKKADKILEEARRASDASVRAKKYKEFVEVISKDLPAIPLYTQLYLYLLPGDMGGVALSQIALPADRFNDIKNWYRKIKRVFF